MLKREIYFAAMRDNAHLKKAWVISAFTVSRSSKRAPVPWSFVYEPDRTLVLVPDESGGLREEVVEGVTPLVPVYSAMEPLELFAGEVPNLHTDVLSTYGDVLFNWRVLVYSFGDRFAYRVGPVKIGALEAEIAERLQDDPLPGEPEDESLLYVRDYVKFGTAITDLADFTQLFVPTPTAKAYQEDPAIIAVRTQRLAENEDQLHNPVVVAGLQNELVAMAKARLKGDPSEGFMLSNKTWNTAYKRMFLIHGPEAGFDEGGDAELVVNSLNEGWDLSKLPAMINSLRAGSYYRGKLTALGGESVKFYMRVFQNTRISEPDCGSTLGVTKKILQHNHLDHVGSYVIEDGKPVLFTVDNIASYIGKVVKVRSPQYCWTANSDYCEICMGKHNSERPNGVSSAASQIGSTHMDIMMGSAHAKEIRSVRLLVDDFLT